MRPALILAAFLGTSSPSLRPADAQTAVVDHSNLLTNIKTALQTAQLVINTANQLDVMKAQLQYQLQNLKTIDPTSITGLINAHQPGPDDLRDPPG